MDPRDIRAMESRIDDTEGAPSAGLALSHGRILSVERLGDVAELRISDASGRGELTIEIRIDPERGPVLRVSAASIELDAAHDVVARCRRFEVVATESVSLRSEGDVGVHAQGRVDVSAATGDVKIQANDDVQLLGEHVLLNCDPTPPMPGWVTGALAAEAPGALPRSDATGDAALLAMLRPTHLT
jgi:hypothetical protein